ncbi:3-hydroxyacyl-CoA dehydrogenase/enoyl-CoA hydratase family protein [Rhizobium azibense]|uniref:3-hydroxyacyl-CoA dehydrogenase n=1 Tax=Rhizobium azibense TaxID=1136135 RepID=A0A4R3R888_9HYPH|nr:3-hydroxyacyl-CoA dehydrogenase/enoyl-CoA hydratase family protein [Rhizobium azibense]TCU31503.1 3-hydroxyacyl-CoA dehydrogenase [Rhizobium azibense]
MTKIIKAAVIGAGTTGLDIAVHLANVDANQRLYGAIDAVRNPGSIVSSNTSSIPLAALIKGLPERFAGEFLVTHFFNRPRIMRLLELVSGPNTKPEVITTIRDFADRELGKTIVVCNDTPKLIGNRIGTYWMLVAQNEAIAMGPDVEAADTIIGEPFGMPSTGILGLIDLFGVDLMLTTLRSLQNAPANTDAIHEYDPESLLISRMIAENRLDQKSGAVFFRFSADRQTPEIADLTTGDYRPMRQIAPESHDASKGGARALMEHPGLGGRIVMEKVLAYAASLVPEVADSPDAVDDAMRIGCGWEYGPFELVDRLGGSRLVEHPKAHGLAVPPYLTLAAEGGDFHTDFDGKRRCLLPDGTVSSVVRGEGVMTIADLKLATKPVVDYGCAALWDLDDGVVCLEFCTKMNTFSEPLLDAINAALEEVGKGFRALVIGSDSPIYSAGADLRVFLERIEKGGADALGEFIDKGHQTFKAVKYVPFPVVGAPAGLAFGGGCEMLLHCDAIQAHAELSIGLVETRIGVVPGWGGCKEMLIRRCGLAGATMGLGASAIATFNLIAPAKVSRSAFEAKSLGFLRSTDGVTINRDRLLADAKQKALSLSDGYVAPEPPLLALSGPSGASAMRNILKSAALAGHATVHDKVVGEALINVLSGGPNADPLKPMTEDDVLALERQAFIALFETPATVERVKHMLATGKSLRN